MSTGVIRDSSITASSILSEAVPASRARLHWTSHGTSQGWVPLTQDVNQWLKIDLSRVRLVSGVATQSSHRVQQFTRVYTLSSSADDSTWKDYPTQGAPKEFFGNYELETVVRHVLTPALYARYVKFHPKVWVSYIGLRAELYTYGKKYPSDLGIESGEIKDSQITASSEFNTGYRATCGRLHYPFVQLSWCARLNVNQYLQFDLGHAMWVTGVVIQGRGHASYLRWVQTFKVSYSQTGSTWVFYKDTGSPSAKVFTGNSNGYIPVTRPFDRNIGAQYLRFNPLTFTANELCMRGGVIGYRQEAKCSAGWIPFRDSCYYFRYDATVAKLHQEARTWCQTFGADLTDVNDEQERAFIARHLDWRSQYMMGLTKVGGTWKWLDGRTPSYSKWSPGEPSGDGTCSSLMAGLFNDFSCDVTKNAFVCKKRADGGFYGSPVIAPDLPDVSAYEHEHLTFQCQAIGDAVIHIAWIHGSDVIQNSSSSNELVLRNVGLGQTGLYSCVATNMLGSDSKSFHFEVKSAFDMCNQFTVLQDNTTQLQNITSLNPSNWYAFQGPTGYTRLPTTCAPQNLCKGAAPGWLNGTHPRVDEGLVKRSVCFHSDQDCCRYSVDVYVRNCYTHYVYKLGGVQASWNVGYCAEHYVQDSPDRIFTTSEEYHSKALRNHVIHTLYHVSSPYTCVLYCMMDRACASFQHSSGLATCELNNATVSSPSNLESRNGYDFYREIQVTTVFI